MIGFSESEFYLCVVSVYEEILEAFASKLVLNKDSHVKQLFLQTEKTTF